jgi:60 kDa SS-A/Ro ribonucleoprotein
MRCPRRPVDHISAGLTLSLDRQEDAISRFSHRAGQPDARNREGAAAFRQSPELALISLLLTSFLTDQFYRSAGQTLAELAALVRAVNPLFAAKAAVYARRRFGMRTVTHVVAGELAARVKGEPWTKRFYDAVVVRPDDVTEILAYYASAHGIRPLPNSLKKGLARALRRFDDYELAKYRGAGHTVNLWDAVNLCHPKPTAPLERLMNDQLPPADTWEVALSQAGQLAGSEEEKAALRRQAWTRLLRDDKLGYFALLRNLRAIVQTCDDEGLALAQRKLVDPVAIHGSRVFPFRMDTALGEVGRDAPEGIRAALDEALEIAFDNVPALEGRTLVALDGSGSMTWHVGGTSPLRKASLLAAAIVKHSVADAVVFSHEVTPVDADPTLSFSRLNARLMAAADCGGTNFTRIFDRAERAYDRIFILSDMQAWRPDCYGYTVPAAGALQRYRRRTGASPRIYSIDVTGYGTMQFPEPRVCQLAGYSEKVFDLVPLYEGGIRGLVAELQAVEI